MTLTASSALLSVKQSRIAEVPFSLVTAWKLRGIAPVDGVYIYPSPSLSATILSTTASSSPHLSSKTSNHTPFLISPPPQVHWMACGGVHHNLLLIRTKIPVITALTLVWLFDGYGSLISSQ